jgi:multimeric flavodoxin WrbA
MKILGINTSPRKVNTYGAIEMVMDGITGPGVEKEIINIASYKVKPCLGCCDCLFKSPYECIQKDDLPVIQKKILEADGYVLGSPVYIMQIAGQLKILIDRCCNWSHRIPLIGKYGVVVSTIAAPAGFARDTIEYMKKWLNMMGVNVVGELSVFAMGGFEAMGPANVHIEDTAGLKERAHEVGKQLAFHMKNKTPYRPTGEDLRIFGVLKMKVPGIGGKDAELWKQKGWLQKDHWSL